MTIMRTISTSNTPRWSRTGRTREIIRMLLAEVSRFPISSSAGARGDRPEVEAAAPGRPLRDRAGEFRPSAPRSSPTASSPGHHGLHLAADVRRRPRHRRTGLPGRATWTCWSEGLTGGSARTSLRRQGCPNKNPFEIRRGIPFRAMPCSARIAGGGGRRAFFLSQDKPLRGGGFGRRAFGSEAQPHRPAPPQCGGTSAPPGARRASPRFTTTGERRRRTSSCCARPVSSSASCLPLSPRRRRRSPIRMSGSPPGPSSITGRTGCFGRCATPGRSIRLLGLRDQGTGPVDDRAGQRRRSPRSPGDMPRTRRQRLLHGAEGQRPQGRSRRRRDPAMTFADGQLTLRFTLPLKAPGAARPRSRSTTRPTSSP